MLSSSGTGRIVASGRRWRSAGIVAAHALSDPARARAAGGRARLRGAARVGAPLRGRADEARGRRGGAFAYSLAKVSGSPLLFKGGDFSHTDVPSTLA